MSEYFCSSAMESLETIFSDWLEPGKREKREKERKREKDNGKHCTTCRQRRQEGKGKKNLCWVNKKREIVRHGSRGRNFFAFNGNQTQGRIFRKR